MEEQILDVPGVGEVRCFRDHLGREASASRMGAFLLFADRGEWVPLHDLRFAERDLTEISRKALQAHDEIAREAAA
jgi:hypothetical protein